MPKKIDPAVRERVTRMIADRPRKALGSAAGLFGGSVSGSDDLPRVSLRVGVPAEDAAASLKGRAPHAAMIRSPFDLAV